MGGRVKCSLFRRSWIRFVKFFKINESRSEHSLLSLLSALIINAVGLGISTIAFVIEKLIHEINCN